MRINFFGGPGSGKSTTTARIFAQLKERQVSVEMVAEYVKAWAYAHRQVKAFDQVYLFGKQHQYEYRFLSAGVKNIVTDSPCFQSTIYARHYGQPQMARLLAGLCKLYDDEHRCLNVFLLRGKKPYVQEGRYQSYDQAKQLDQIILECLREYYPNNLVFLDYADQQGILDTVLEAIE